VAKKIVLVSDITGRSIESGDAVKIRLTFEDGRKGAVELDARSDEVTELVEKGRKVGRRGRPRTAPKSSASSLTAS
jgi:hypothetical protein